MKYLAFNCWVLLLSVNMAWCETYHWPMDAEPALTSTFGEYRGGRLHAAIDLKTWGKEGFPVVAVEEGYVWRVRTSPWGYGRAVYVQLKDGRFAIWAHLSGFSDVIEQYVKEEQDRRETYSVNLYFRADQLPVKKGDVVGYSGSTGIGVPHLHFELRDGDHRPLNPLTHGFDIKDTTPPTISAIGVVPLNAHSLVNGTSYPQAFDVVWHGKKKQFVCADTLVASGQIGMGMRVYDRADASALTNKLAPYKLRLLVNKKEAFATTFDVFGYGVTHHGELDRNFMMSQRGLGRFHNLYRGAGNYLPFYGSYRIGDGILHAGDTTSRTGLVLPKGVHRVTVIAEDVKGNTAEAVVMMRVVDMPKIQTLDVAWMDQAVTVQAQLQHIRRARFAFSEDSGKTWQPLGAWLSVQNDVKRTLKRVRRAIYRLDGEDGFGQKVFVTFSEPVQELPQLECVAEYFPTFSVVKIQANRSMSQLPLASVHDASGQEKNIEVRQTGLMTYEAVVAFDVRAEKGIVFEVQGDGKTTSVVLKQTPITPSGGGVLVSDDHMAIVRFERDGVYETLFGHVVADTAMADARMVGMAYRMMPDDVAFEKAEVILKYPQGVADTSKIGLYAWDVSKGWIFVDIGRDTDMYAVNGEVKHLGIFALLIDDVPPEILEFHPANHHVVRERQPKIWAKVRDVSSGIWREEDYEMRIDGQKLIVEYDPEEDMMFAQPSIPLTVGTHQVEMIVRDICGNETRQVHMVVVE
jgi:hypothetical protein